jgi:hypothetical protein
VAYHEVQTGLAMNNNERLTPEQRAKLERLRQHQAQFQHRRMIAGFCRWMASRFGSSTARPEGPATVDTLHKPPVATEDGI